MSLNAAKNPPPWPSPTPEFFKTTTFLALRCPSAAGDPWANQAWEASFFSLTAYLTTGVHQQVLRLVL